MFDAIKQRRYLILAVVLAAAVILGVAYLFASKKSEPVYLSKIDRLMFERENLAPKYVLTLPDKNKIRRPKVQKIIEDGKDVSPQEDKVQNGADFDLAKFMASIPMLSRLPVIANPKPLADIELNAGLSEKVGNMRLPKISARGKKPWVEYGYKVDVAPNFNKVAVVVKNFGLDSRLSETAVGVLPGEVSLAFSPYTQKIAEAIRAARRNGHETYMDLLLSSPNFLKSDSGPMAMSLTASADENLLRLQQSLNVEAPIGGVVVNSGVAGDDTQETLNKIFAEITSRGLLMLDATDSSAIEEMKSSGLARKRADIVIEDDLSKESIKKRFEEAEEVALLNGQVVVVIEPKPVAIVALHEWINSFSPQLSYEDIKKGAKIEKPFRLVPLSMVVVE